MIKIAIFASGAGSNALNLLENARKFPHLSITHLIVDTQESPLPQLVQEKFPQVQCHRLLPNQSLKGQERKKEHETRITALLKDAEVEWILLAGYMRILGEVLLTRYKNRIVNIHPSLLPLYPGVDSYRRAFEDGVSESGVTIHLVDEGVDTGPVIFQEKFTRDAGDTLSDFIQKGKELEWRLYPRILEMINNSAAVLPGV